jgi:hypothetical protein
MRSNSSVPKRLHRWSVLVIVLAAGAACAGEGTPGDDSAAAGADSPRMAQRVEILTPANGDTVASDIRVTLGTTGVTIIQANNLVEEGRGHHHLFLDADVTPPDVAIPPATAQIIHLGTGATEYTFAGVAPGPHRIIAVVAYGNHVPMAGTMTDTVNVVVRAP